MACTQELRGLSSYTEKEHLLSFVNLGLKTWRVCEITLDLNTLFSCDDMF